jgi:hypothetical protein
MVVAMKYALIKCGQCHKLWDELPYARTVVAVSVPVSKQEVKRISTMAVSSPAYNWLTIGGREPTLR